MQAHRTSFALRSSQMLPVLHWKEVVKEIIATSKCIGKLFPMNFPIEIGVLNLKDS